jgi:rare lipoprotein A
MVNDRGPFSKKRIIDVSERAAEILKMKIKGSAKVKVEYLPKETEELLAKLALPAVNGAKAKSKGVNVATKYLESINDIVKIELASAEKPNKIKTVGKGGKKIFIQVGAFKHKNNALTVATQLAKLGKLDVKNPTSKANPLYKVHLGPIDDHQAEQILSELISLGNDAKIIKNPDSRG